MFVMKHVFENLPSSANGRTHHSPEEEHFGGRWKLHMNETSGSPPFFCLYCHKNARAHWGVHSKVTLKLLKTDGTWETSISDSSISNTIRKSPLNTPNGELSEYLIDGKISIEIEVKIKGMTIFGAPWKREFDDDEAKEFSDVVLVAGTDEFHVNKMYLSLHSTYFKSLFSSLKSTESLKKPIIELNDVHPMDLQYFLEVLYGEPTVRDFTVDGVLELAEKYKAKTVMRRCEEFLEEKSKISRKRKFELAVRYDLETLKRKCIDEAKTTAEIRELAPDDAEDFGPNVWKELFLKACSSK
ncbi:unnamed protein product [Caenorhabditis nigoni]